MSGTCEKLMQHIQAQKGAGAGRCQRLQTVVGIVVGIYALLWISNSLLELQGATMVVASMGATAVLLFTLPDGPFSKSWPVFGGHMVSAFVGVSSAKFVPDPLLAAALAVGFAMVAMTFMRCVHPPGGATAMVAVLGGDSIQQLGYGFVFQPVMVNALIVLAVATLINYIFRYKHYFTQGKGFSALKLDRSKAPASKGGDGTQDH
ncbi:MAG: HPP family protein [Gammaproteobacteria bacterium]|nr:MAG: HPP family protein [Gammaproteobacteria bacterium]